MKGTPSTFYKKLDQKYASAAFASQSSTRWQKWKEHHQWARSPARKIWFTAGDAAKERWICIKANVLPAALGKAEGWENIIGRKR